MSKMTVGAAQVGAVADRKARLRIAGISTGNDVNAKVALRKLLLKHALIRIRSVHLMLVRGPRWTDFSGSMMVGAWRRTVSPIAAGPVPTTPTQRKRPDRVRCSVDSCRQPL
jgi:hypothetical protein